MKFCCNCLLRWQPPVQKQPWTGTRAAWTYSASCVQGDNAFTLFTPVDEDCLYLNLWLPASPSPTPRPAMIFFYGGSDDTGSAMFPLYSGGNLVAESNETVVIAVNYRLNVFGWLGSDQLRGRDNSTGKRIEKLILQPSDEYGRIRQQQAQHYSSH